MGGLEQRSNSREYSFQEHETSAGLLVGSYVVRYSGREGSDLFFRLSVFDHLDRYSWQPSITVKLCNLEYLDLIWNGVLYSLKPKEVYSEIDLDVHARWGDECVEAEASPLKDILLPRLSEAPLMSGRVIQKSNG